MRLRHQIAGIIALVLGFTLFIGASAPHRPFPAQETQQALVGSPLTQGNADALFLAMPEAEILKFLDDPRNLLNDDFQVPPAIRPMVNFWFLVYTKYSLYHSVIYDEEDLNTIYEVLDNRDLFQRGLGPIALEISIKNRIKKRLTDYRQAFGELQRNPKKRFAAGTKGARILGLWGRKSSKQWQDLANRLRVQTGQRNRVIEGLSVAERFFPAMEAIFRKFRVPVELTRIPLVESSFNIRAHSSANAVGVWQFLERSALEYLVVDKFNRIDERISPIKSTYAAAKMFRQNYRILGDWGLATIAYNHGVRNLRPIRQKYARQKISKLLVNTETSPLGFASRNYYAEFLAMLHAERYRQELFGMDSKSYSEAISIVRMRRPATMFELALQYNISIHELRVFNPDIFDLKRRLPPGTRIVLPKKHGESLVQAPAVFGVHDTSRAPAQTGGELAKEVEYIEYVAPVTGRRR